MGTLQTLNSARFSVEFCLCQTRAAPPTPALFSAWDALPLEFSPGLSFLEGRVGPVLGPRVSGPAPGRRLVPVRGFGECC